MWRVLLILFFVSFLAASDYHSLSLKKVGQRYFSEMQMQVKVGAFAGAYVMAHSSIDQSFQDYYRRTFTAPALDRWSARAKVFGEGKYLLGLWSALALFSKGEAAFWAQQSLKSAAIAGPFVVLTQRLTGASRPGERSQASYWRFWQDENGVSGHAFMGALPFLTLAKQLDNSSFKSLALLLSSTCAWSRVHDNRHYLSQVLLGYLLAWQAVEAAYDKKVSAQASAIQGQGTGLRADDLVWEGWSATKGMSFHGASLSWGF